MRYETVVVCFKILSNYWHSRTEEERRISGLHAQDKESYPEHPPPPQMRSNFVNMTVIYQSKICKFIKSNDSKQDRQSRYNVTLRHAHETTIAVNKHKVLRARARVQCTGAAVCFRARVGLLNPACNAPAQSSAVSLAPPYLWTLSHKGHDFRKTLLDIKCIF